jgi:hypothetical protein
MVSKVQTLKQIDEEIEANPSNSEDSLAENNEMIVEVENEDEDELNQSQRPLIGPPPAP